VLTVVAAYAAIALSWGGTWVVAKAAVGQVPPIELSAIRSLASRSSAVIEAAAGSLLGRL
jgi:hypothetical protein